MTTFKLVLQLEQEQTRDQALILDQIELGEFPNEAEARAALELILEAADVDIVDEDNADDDSNPSDEDDSPDE